MGLTISRKPAAATASMLDDLKKIDQEANAAATQAIVDEAKPLVAPAQPKAEAAPLPWEEQAKMQTEDQTKDNNILIALHHLATQTKKDTLMLIRNSSKENFLVLAFDPDTSQVHLEAKTDGRRFKVKVSDRENQFYSPFWR